MKINDKHLSNFATSNSVVDKEGHLLKRGDLNKSFQKRWFVLKGNLLFYFDKKGDKEPIGVIILEGCTVELAESVDSFTFELVFPGATSRTYVLAAEKQEEMEDWMKAIACAGYDYMKLMVSELQRQLDEINSTEANSAANVKAFGGSASSIKTDGETLIDLSFPEASNKQPTNGGNQRSNPFGDGNVGTNLDAFGLDPFKPQGIPSSSGPNTRTFVGMHRDFGNEIEDKIKQAGQIPPFENQRNVESVS